MSAEAENGSVQPLEAARGKAPLARMAIGASLADASGKTSASGSTGKMPVPPADVDELWLKHFRAESANRYSIRDLMAATALAAIALASLRWVPTSVAAATMGLIVMLGVGFFLGDSQLPRLFHLCWWVMLGLYILLAAAAAVQ